ncbi:MAG: hypothetical protein WAP35_10005 [Solirubrobacterales bacterium]
MSRVGHSLASPRVRLAGSVLIAATIAALVIAGTGVGAGSTTGTRPVPILGPAASIGDFAGEDVWLMGAAAAGEPGEAWAFQNLPASTPEPRVGSRQLDFAAPTSTGVEDPHPVFLRFTDATGWQVFETPTSSGTPIARFSPVFASASITPHGGGVLLGTADSLPVALIRQPGGRFQVSQPPVTVLLPAGPDGPAEHLVSERRAPATAFERDGKTAVFAAATGREAESIVHFDGDAWSREVVDYPVGAEDDFEIIALGATGADNAWLLARVDETLGRGVVLLRRSIVAGTPRWVEQSLGNAMLSASSTASASISGLAALDSTAQGGADPLTVTADGLWIDGRFESGDDVFNFTAFFDRGDGRVTSTWCDLLVAGNPVCDRRLGVAFSRENGYRSTAWPGPGFGTRIVTNPLDPGTVAQTNRGTYLKLVGSDFLRMPGAGTNSKVTSALSSDSTGWLTSTVRLQSTDYANRTSPWSVGARSPLRDVAAEPGKPVAGLQSAALTVGDNGSVARFAPGTGWVTEFLLSSSGLVRRPDLRGVAWPEPIRAHAVGSYGEMWLWRAETGQWERDPGAPIGLDTHLMDVAFRPGDPYEGFAVGREGMLLEYGKGWQQICAPGNNGAACKEGDALPAKFARADFRQIAYSGSDVLVAAGTDVMVRSGGSWGVDAQLSELIDRYRRRSASLPQILTVAGLPDGAAMVAGTGGLAFRRDRAGAPWRPIPQPLASASIVESALFREGGTLRSVVSISRHTYPPGEVVPPQAIGDPQPRLDPLKMPAEGFVLRETAHSWRDEQGDAFDAVGNDVDKPVKPDATLGMLIDPSGEGWLVGGVNGQRDAGLRGFDSESPPARVTTAAISRYSQSPQSAGYGAATPTPVGQSLSTVNFMVGGHAACENRNCSQFRHLGIAPDRQLETALAMTHQMSRQLNGPRFFMYTGGRSPESTRPVAATEAARYAELLGSQPELPTYTTVSAADSAGGDLTAYRQAFGGFGAPLGDGPPAAGISARGAGSGTRTHYSFDSRGTNGTIRVIVIDNSRGSLAASDPHQNPPVASQEDWLRGELRAAKADQTPAVVVGSRDLNTVFAPALNTATTAAEKTEALRVASMMRDEGASAYFFERPEENRYYSIPADGSANPIPSFGTGTLGYRAEESGSSTRPSSFFGNTGMLLAQVDIAARNPQTNRAPVSVRMIPLIENLNLEAIDGTLLRRSTPALFAGLGRRPIAGDRWGPGDIPSPAGSDPYTIYPSEKCRVAACQTKIEPEYEFRSEHPDIADFVAVDPQSNNLRKPLLTATGKTISDGRSGLLCAYNAGTTTVSVTSGGFTYARQITVLPGTIRQPCGTRPLDPSRFPPSQPKVAVPPPPPPPPSSPPLALNLPPAPIVKPTPKPSPRPVEDAFLAPLSPGAVVPVVTPPPAPSLARPIPPTGGMSRVFEEKREEEAATEDSQAFARYDASQPPNSVYSLTAMALLAAFATAGTGRRRGGSRAAPASAFTDSSQPRSQPRRFR